jgi:hypothetical protein
VADYDPINDDRGSLARGYEPTSKAMHTASTYITFSVKNDIILFNSFFDTINFEKIFEDGKYDLHG